MYLFISFLCICIYFLFYYIYLFLSSFIQQRCITFIKSDSNEHRYLCYKIFENILKL